MLTPDDSSGGCDWPPDASDSGGNGIEPKSPISNFMEVLRLVPGAAATIPEILDTSDGSVTPEMPVQGYDFQRRVKVIDSAGIIRLLGGEDEAEKHLFAGLQIIYLREHQDEGKINILLMNGSDNHVLVPIGKEPIAVFSSRFLDSAYWDLRLRGPPYGFEEGSRILLRQEENA